MSDRLQDSFFRALFDSPFAGAAVADLTNECVVATNAKMLEILGRPREDIEGVPFAWRSVTPPEYHHLDETALRQFIERGYSDPFEKEYLRPDGSRVAVRVSAIGVEGHPDKLVILVHDIRAERAARESERQMYRRLQIALSAAQQGIWDWNLVTGEMIYSDRAKEIYGLPVDQPVAYTTIRDATHPDDLPMTSALLKRAIDPAIRDRSSYEYRIIRPDKSVRWILAFGEAVFSGDPGAERAVRYAGTIQDITDRKNAERHQQILIAELNHRVKNTLAVVQALAFQTFKGGIAADAMDSFSGRLAALAAAHDILTKSKWESASLGDIASRVLEPHATMRSGRIQLRGDEAQVHPQLAVNLAMALHELATNATKYGALSNGSGSVDLSWSLSGDTEPQLHLDWREQGGPEISPPQREGFGTRMLKRILANELRGSVRMEFRPQGLECSIEAPLRKLPHPAA